MQWWPTRYVSITFVHIPLIYLSLLNRLGTLLWTVWVTRILACKNCSHFLAEHGIKFDPVDQCIMCFLHILNICAGYIAYQYTDADFSAIGAAWVDALDPTIGIDKTAYIAALWQDRVGIGHDIVCLMHASSLHHESFDNIVVTRKKSNWFISDDHKLMKLWVLELLRDVKLHWDSIYLMINLLQCFSFPMSSSLFP